MLCSAKKYPPPVVVSREEWHAKRPVDWERLLTPVRYVLLNLDTGTPSCSGRKECCKLIKRLQVETVKDLGYSDIRYNFLISDDGTIFEGRGWNKTPEEPLYPYYKYNGAALNIAYIGSYVDREPPWQMVQAKNCLIAFGIANEYIHHKYEIIEVTENI